MKIIKKLISALIILLLIIVFVIGVLFFVYTLLKNRGYTDTQIIGAAMYASVLSIVCSAGFTLIYNIFIGFPIGLIIEKQKKYKEVRAFWTLSESRSNEATNINNVFTYEWEVNGKKYRRTIHTSAWPGAIATFYYLKNPKHAMPIPREISNFKYQMELLGISFIIIYFIAIRLI